MSIDFTTLQGLTIPEGVVTQITDESGRVIWAAMTDEPIVLEVILEMPDENYVGDSTYYDDMFVRLDIYPQNANSVVKVTRGGLTKTLTFSDIYAQPVTFGRYGGVSDDSSGSQLIIEGGCLGVGNGTYNVSKNSVAYCDCITNIIAWGSMEEIVERTFTRLISFTDMTIPEGITSIRTFGFSGCRNLVSVSIPNSMKNLDVYAFAECLALTSVTFGNPNGWYVTQTEGGDISTGTVIDLTNPSNNAEFLTNTYYEYYWYRS